jgi:hypothetical protein
VRDAAAHQVKQRLVTLSRDGSIDRRDHEVVVAGGLLEPISFDGRMYHFQFTQVAWTGSDHDALPRASHRLDSYQLLIPKARLPVPAVTLFSPTAR